MASKNRVGAVLHISHSSGNLILKSKTNVKIGEAVRDNKGKRVGTVFDVFGPVSDPYISIKTRTSNPERLVGTALYVGASKRR